ncbi:palmitoyl-protein thioesterase ABHD10, mitochondrial isoform X2 [Lampetra fluviatilis]
MATAVMAALLARPRLLTAARSLAGGSRWKSSVSYLSRADAPRLAYSLSAGKSPGVLFLPGFASSMDGAKGTALHHYCRSVGHASTRFDYTGCGASEGDSSHWGVGQWKSDVLTVLDQLTTGPQILVGSSLGAWLMVLAAVARPERVVGLVGVASAPDFLQRLHSSLTDEERAEAQRTGEFRIPYSPPTSPSPSPSPSPSSKTHITIPLAAVLEAARHSLLVAPAATATATATASSTADALLPLLPPLPPLPVRCPVRLLHGLADDVAPWQLALRLAERLASAEVDVTLRKGAGHRFSEPADLRLLASTLDDLVDRLTTHT